MTPTEREAHRLFSFCRRHTNRESWPILAEALTRAEARGRAEGLREAARIAAEACLVPPDGGSPTEDEHNVCQEAKRRILARAAALDAAEKGEAD